MSSVENGLELRKLTSTGINKDGDIYKALFSDTDGKGAIADELDDVTDYIDEFLLKDSLLKLSGDNLEKVVSFFSDLSRKYGESDANLLLRFRALTYRNGDTVWGTKWDIISVFIAMFAASKVNVFIVENTNDMSTENLLDNPEFEIEGNTSWTMNNCELSATAKFSKEKGVLFTGDGYASQKVAVAKGSFFFHCFAKGTVKIFIEDADTSEYWDASGSKWTSSESSSSFTNTDWDCIDEFFITAAARNVLIKVSASAGAMFDYTMLFQKKKYCSFTVIIQFFGESKGAVMHLSGGGADPDAEHVPDYAQGSYYDQTFLTGYVTGNNSEMYKNVLKSITPKGIKSYMEFVAKTY